MFTSSTLLTCVVSAVTMSERLSLRVLSTACRLPSMAASVLSPSDAPCRLVRISDTKSWNGWPLATWLLESEPMLASARIRSSM